jgi:CBS domain-containing protein
MNRFEEHVTSATVRDLGPLHTPIVVKEATGLDEVIARMVAGHTGCVLIVGDGGELRGIFTERDLLRRVIGPSLPFSTPVREVMTTDPDTISSTDTVMTAIRAMHEGSHRHLPVVDDGIPVGVVSARSLIRHLAELYPAAVYNLPPDFAQKYDEAEGA